MAGRGRPPLPVGTWGKISVTKIAESKTRGEAFRAITRFRDFDGETRRVTATGATAAAAERELKIILRDRAAPTTGNEMTPGMRVEQASAVWLDLLVEEGGRENTTVAGYRRIVDKIINPAIGNLRLREVTTARLQRLILAQGSEAGRKSTKTVLGMLFEAAVLDEALTVNPARGTARLKRTKKEVRALKVEDLNAVRSAVQAWIHKPRRGGPKPTQDIADIVDLMLATGCRIGEVLAIRWTDVVLDAPKPIVFITGTVKKEPGMPVYRKPKPKSTSSERGIILPPFAVEVLLRRRVEQPGNHYNAVFATRNGTWFQVGNIEKKWRAIRTDTGFEWVTPHVFRKTVATLINDNADSQTAAKVLGHSNDAITKEHYIERDKVAPDVSDLLQEFAAPTRPRLS